MSSSSRGCSPTPSPPSSPASLIKLHAVSVLSWDPSVSFHLWAAASAASYAIATSFTQVVIILGFAGPLANSITLLDGSLLGSLLTGYILIKVLRQPITTRSTPNLHTPNPPINAANLANNTHANREYENAKDAKDEKDAQRLSGFWRVGAWLAVPGWRSLEVSGRLRICPADLRIFYPQGRFLNIGTQLNMHQPSS